MGSPEARLGQRWAIWALVLGWGLILPLAADARGGGESGDSHPAPLKPRLRLEVTPSVGFIPLQVILNGQLTGVEPLDANFCHPAVTWLRVDPGQREDEASLYHEDAACRHPPSESRAMTSFTRSLQLYRPGSYLFRLIVEGKDHRRVESAFVKVEALRVQ